MGDLAAFVRDHFVPLFDRGVASLDRKARNGDAEAQAALDDIRAVGQAVHVDPEGDDGFYLVVESGRMSLADEPPRLPIRMAVALPSAAMKPWIQDASEQARSATDDIAERVARTVSKRFDDALGDEPLNFHLIFTDPPDSESIVVRVGLGAETPPTQPGFTAAMPWDAFEELRRATPQSFLMSGRVRFSGDYGRAMQLALRLIEPPAQ